MVFIFLVFKFYEIGLNSKNVFIKFDRFFMGVKSCVVSILIVFVGYNRLKIG